MAVKTRQGRKTVTIVTGLETFGVDIEEFAEELRKLCAGSASSESGVRGHALMASPTVDRIVPEAQSTRNHGAGATGQGHHRGSGREGDSQTVDQGG
jgi:hypothetical protein